jgi:hypothetical protein
MGEAQRKTHAFRKFTTQLLGEQGVPEREIAQLGVWEHHSVMENYYLQHLPYKAIKANAGVREFDKPDSYRLFR